MSDLVATFSRMSSSISPAITSAASRATPVFSIACAKLNRSAMIAGVLHRIPARDAVLERDRRSPRRYVGPALRQCRRKSRRGQGALGGFADRGGPGAAADRVYDNRRDALGLLTLDVGVGEGVGQRKPVGHRQPEEYTRWRGVGSKVWVRGPAGPRPASRTACLPVADFGSRSVSGDASVRSWAPSSAPRVPS